MMWGMPGCCGGVWGWFWMLLLLVLFVGIAVYLLRFFANLLGGGGQTRTPPPSGSRDDPLRILKERYARGEITREEFEQMKRDIEST